MLVVRNGSLHFAVHHKAEHIHLPSFVVVSPPVNLVRVDIAQTTRSTVNIRAQ